MAITFPTRPPPARGCPHGQPVEADACQCGEQRLTVDDADTCFHCGRYDWATIRNTWLRRARALA